MNNFFPVIWKPLIEEKGMRAYNDVNVNAINLHLMTNTSENDVRSIVRFRDREVKKILDSGGFTLRFSSKPRLVEYRFDWCSNFKTFPVSIPTSREKVWTIQKRGYRMAVSCNGKKVLNKIVSSEVCDDPEYSSTWNISYWGRKVDQLIFPMQGEATLFYYIGTVQLMFMLREDRFFPPCHVPTYAVLSSR